MPMKGMKSLMFTSSFSSSLASSPVSSPRSTPQRRLNGGALTAPPSPLRLTFSVTMMEDNIELAEAIILKWDLNSSSYARVTSLFYEDRDEARKFLDAVNGLQRAMLFFASIGDDAAVNTALRSRMLMRGQPLMQSAMRRLEHEFHQIITTNRDRFDPESVSTRSSLSSLNSERDEFASDDDEIRLAADDRAFSTAVSDLRSIADTMISAGYGKECVHVYKNLRRSAVDEGVSRLGFQKLSYSQVQKLDWQTLELKIMTWLSASRTAVENVFGGEREFIHHVFPDSKSIQEACFADITREIATQFFAFPEHVARYCRRSPEKLFRVLDLYTAIGETWPEIEFIFSLESTAAVRNQAMSSLTILGQVAGAMLAEFESSIQKEASKTPVPGCGVHPLTRYSMNYIALLADYEPALADIYADSPFNAPGNLPEPLLDVAQTPSTSSPSSPVSVSPSSYDITMSPYTSHLSTAPPSSEAARLAWLVLVLLCKLDSKAEAYKDVGFSYLFLANNLQYVISKVRGSALRLLFGEDWVSRHVAKTWRFAGNYSRVTWGKVAAAVPARNVALEQMPARMRAFNRAFEEACARAQGLVVTDAGMRDEIIATVTVMVLPAYRGAYEQFRSALSGSAAAGVVRFAPEDARNRITGLFTGSAAASDSSNGSGSNSSSGSRSGSRSGSLWSRLRTFRSK